MKTKYNKDYMIRTKEIGDKIQVSLDPINKDNGGVIHISMPKAKPLKDVFNTINKAIKIYEEI